MASGKTHDQLTYVAAALAIPAALALRATVFQSWFFAIGLLWGGLWLSPDLDLRSTPWERWGVLKVVWLPYQKALPHRSFWSHTAIIGTAGRLLYLGVFILPLLTLVGLGDDFLLLLHRYPREILWWVAGVEAGAVIHLIADMSIWRRF